MSLGAWITLAILLVILAVLAGGAWRTRVLAARAERLVPRIGQVQPVPGGMIHFVKVGDPERQTLVLIHGLAGQLQQFTYALTDRLSNEFHVIALDRPGCGYSTRDGDDLAALPRQAEMIAAFLEARGIDRAVLVGHSLGGAVALATALDHPERVAGLALLAPLTHPVGEVPDVFRPLAVRSAWLRRALGHTIAIPVGERTAEAVLTEVFAPEDWPDDFLVAAGGALGLRPQAYVAACADLVASGESIAGQAARYDELSVPGAILFGAGDTVLAPAAHGTTMARHGLPTTLLPGRGHMIPLTAPEDCEAFIRSTAEHAEPRTSPPTHGAGKA
ncbi:Pimeloyl-ACP methyl ester carboxylesterase [Cribrihabitans marinus]|uniref:Pimeloyl-ACP methyl ester carboxylesterase n=1 Tax=Cribrihabitans marinus TaxID=1227549 RepID=A0A1H6S7W4_9RHOB|nr:alpha/beta fold hydrolase [Cribrihabitans marinus]GGH23974.1 alpha/beta hydrolase [Cribrihabitans marinus]SEI62866.1 Pimeloyl-ACP methyl ester carboxylesterase [Cribrihabitans marinus]